MDGDAITDRLRSVYPTNSSSSFAELLNDLDTPKDPTVEQITASLSKSLLVVPATYVTRKGSQIYICGMVDKGTEEFDQGFRYFSDTSNFFAVNGQCHQTKTCPDDVYAVDNNSESNIRESLSYKWIHPHHWIQSNFFRKLSHKTTIFPGRYYLNRMGFVVHLTQTPVTKDDKLFFQDCNQYLYLTDGSISETTSSMFDLIYEIKNWDLISQVDWSSETIPVIVGSDDDIPELFNPAIYDERTLWSELFEYITKAQHSAKRLGTPFSFSLGVNAS